MGYTAFQPNAFQNLLTQSSTSSIKVNAFQVDVATAVIPGKTGGGGIGAGQFTRGQWHALRKEQIAEAEAKARKEQRAEHERQAAIAAGIAEAKEKRERKRAAEDLDWGLRRQVVSKENATASVTGAQRMSQQMYQHSLLSAAAQRAQLKRKQDEDDEDDIERLLLQ